MKTDYLGLHQRSSVAKQTLIWRAPSRANGGGTYIPQEVPGYVRRLPPAPSNAQSIDEKGRVIFFHSRAASSFGQVPSGNRQVFYLHELRGDMESRGPLDSSRTRGRLREQRPACLTI